MHGVDGSGAVVVRRRLTRAKVLPFFEKLPPCLVGLEACATAHYWGRELRKLGHDVRLMPPSYVKPYVKRQKNDAADAEAICEAVTRPSMHFVEIKSPEQQSIMSLHRDRSGRALRSAASSRSPTALWTRSFEEVGSPLCVRPAHRFPLPLGALAKSALGWWRGRETDAR